MKTHIRVSPAPAPQVSKPAEARPSLSPNLSGSTSRLSFSQLCIAPGLSDRLGAAESAGEQLIDQALGPVIPGPIAPPAPASGGPTVRLPAHVRAATTPSTMADRIPPRVDTPVSVAISGWHIPMANVEVSVEGTGSGNGDVSVNGASSASLQGSATVQLRGVTQTDPGNAGRLHLVARQGSAELARSGAFSVAAIIQDVVVSFNTLLTGSRRGIVVDTTWASDSGSRADLDEVEFSEQVQYDAGSGCLAGAGATAQNSGYLPADVAPLTDTHGTPVSILTSPGGITAEQTFIFKDDRTGAVDLPTRNSGFRIVRTVTEPAPGTFQITTAKGGQATSANGHASAAGSGSVSRTQAV